MKCPLCKGEMSDGQTNLSYEINKDRFLVIKNVPALVCDQCGEPFIDIKITRKVEKIISEAEKDGILIGIVKFKEAA
ncbi:MAG: YgiT-type zinc finger domain-containing protein [Bdellovibrionales bacterium RBG_16_40_8]|nr:MAG: YgiT-type zinc finger domain-containing protein [Bdellovibrionales bacterium RBG_16_40_8]